MKKYLKIDSFLATLLVFAFIFGIKPLFKFNLYVFDPVHAAMTDVKFNDLAFSTFQSKAGTDTNIVLVNTGEVDRGRIATLLESIKTHGPKVTGLDIMFLEPQSDTAADRRLESVVRDYPGLVMAEKMEWQGERPVITNQFSDLAKNSGYANFIGEEKGVIRYYSPFERRSDHVHRSFTTSMLEIADPAAYLRLLERDNEFEMINFRRRQEDYLVLEEEDFIRNRIEKGFLKNKTLLVGYLNPDTDYIKDKHYTPLNDRFIGKSRPDMNGMVIHANILSMAMEDRFIRNVPTWLTFLISFLFTAFMMSYFIGYRMRLKKWFHIYYKLLQLVTGTLLVFLGTLLLSRAGVYFDSTMLLIALALSVDILYFYMDIADWLHSRLGFKTVFATKKH